MSQHLLSAFSHSGQTFSIVSHDQRLKVFNVLTQQLQLDLTEPNHLTSQHTAIALPTNAKGPAAHIIAVGTKAGDVLLWNTRKGEVEQRLGSASEKHQSAITSLAFHSSGAFLFSASADKTLKQWNVSNGAFVASFSCDDATAFSRIATSPDGNLLVAGGVGALTLWNIATPSTPLREYQGPTDRISCVAFSPDSKYIVSGNSNDRYLTLWTTETEEEETNGKKKKSKSSNKNNQRNTPVHTITLTTPPIQAQFNAFLQSKKEYQIAVLADSSIASVFQWSPSSSSSSSSSSNAPASSTPQVTITVPSALSQSEQAKRRDAAYNALNKNNKQKSSAASSTLLGGELGDSVGQGVILALAFESSTKLSVARGDAVHPQFESVEFKKGDAFESTIVLAKFQSQHLMSGSTTAQQAQGEKKRKAAAASLSNEAVTLGAQHTRDTVQTASSGLDGEPANKKAKIATTKSKSDALSRSLADRLAESESALTTASFDLSTGELPKAGSLQTILQQALHSNDTALVEYCLTAGAQQMASNSTLIRSTVKRLSPAYVLPLLNHLMSKFASRPNRSAQLLPWLREIFKNHTAYLIRQPQLTHKLSPLYHLLDTRLSVFKKLLKLQGRLELLLSQISTAKNQGRDEEEEAAQGPLNVFNDAGDDDEEEDDEEREPMSGEDEEEEDGEDDDEMEEDEDADEEQEDEEMEDEEDEE